MSQQALDLRRSTQIIKRHKFLVGVLAALGLLAGGAYGLLSPQLFTSTALVVLQSSGSAAAGSSSSTTDPFTATQEIVAGSTEVLQSALPNVSPAMSLNQLRNEIQVGNLTPFIISIAAKAKVASDAVTTANAVANSYLSYIGSTKNVAHVTAQLLEPTTSASEMSWIKRVLVPVVVGGAAGALLGVILSLAISHKDRRLRQRDEIANSIGIPVLASLPVGHASDAGGWTRLIEDYKPDALHAWRLHKVLQQFGRPGDGLGNGSYGARSSLVIVSLASDPGALALGPQLAVFAASVGIPTLLVIGPQQDPNVTAALWTACAAPPSTPPQGHLRVTVSEDGNVDGQQDAELIIYVVVVDGHAPQVPVTIRCTTTVMGVSAGAATAEQLARVAVSAAADGRAIAGILVADPEPSDHTTGYIPHMAQHTPSRMPTRLNGTMTEIRR
jgi:capsular polysaccharide biosynthesis protein